MYTYTKQRVKRKQIKSIFANFTYTSMIFEITWFWLLSQISVAIVLLYHFFCTTFGVSHKGYVVLLVVDGWS